VGKLKAWMYREGNGKGRDRVVENCESKVRPRIAIGFEQ